MMLQEFRFFRRVFKLAYKALKSQEWPIAAVIVRNQTIVSSAINMVETLNDPTAHAEIIAAKRAMQVLHTRYLEDCTLLVNLQPCNMCYFFLKALRIKKIIYSVENYSICYCDHSMISGIYTHAHNRLFKQFTCTLRTTYNMILLLYIIYT